MSFPLRWDIINEFIQEVKLNSSDKNANERYEKAVNSIRENHYLNPSEKEVIRKYFIREKDRENLLFLKGPKYKCDKCNLEGYTLAYCELCLRNCLKLQFGSWTSRNEIIDKAIQDSQIKLPLPVQIMEWIPYDDIKDVQHLASGGCAEIYTATWTNGYIKSFNKETQQFERSGPWKCIIKRFTNSKNADVKFFEEIKLHISLRASAYKLVGCRGVTRDPITGDYMLVLDQMQHDLRNYSRKNISSSLSLKNVYRFGLEITTALAQIHKEGLIHKDLHSGNVLQRPDCVWVIGDLGFCGPPNKPSSHLYGCIPYLAPEILYKTSRSEPVYYTSASDIYSFGMLMYEIAIGPITFGKSYHDHKELAAYICNGVRPEVPSGLPEDYVSLMKQCWKADPSERPTVTKLRDFFFDQCKSLKDELLQRPTNQLSLTPQEFEIKSALYQLERLPKPKDASIFQGLSNETSTETLRSENISENNVSEKTIVSEPKDDSNIEKSIKSEKDLNMENLSSKEQTDKLSEVSVPFENKKWKRIFRNIFCKC